MILKSLQNKIGKELSSFVSVVIRMSKTPVTTILKSSDLDVVELIFSVTIIVLIRYY